MRRYIWQSDRLKTNPQRGSALLSIIIMFPFLILIIALYLQLSIASFNQSRSDQYRTHAQFATDAGTDYAVQQINADEDWNGTTAPVEIHNDGKVKTEFEIAIDHVDSDTKTITSIGRTYSPVDSLTAKSTITIKTDLRAVTSGNFSIVTGVGGLYMSNSAKILGGDVYVNGEISMTNTAQIGTIINPVVLSVAHQNCPIPVDSTYPAPCGDGEPITISNQAHIYGDVRANNQIDGSGMSNPGLTTSSGVAALPLPIHDRAGQVAAVTTTITGSAASCTNNQTRTWAANTKITGDVSITNGCDVTVEGDIWITGRLTLQNSSKIIIADSLGTTIPDIMVDGSAGVLIQNSAEIEPNSSSTGAQFITYWSRASCSPDCADVTGEDLYNSRNDRTIYLQNNTSASNSIVYARWTQAELGNGGNIGAVVGQTVRLSNSATITFGSSVPGVSTTGWVIDNYRRTFN